MKELKDLVNQIIRTADASFNAKVTEVDRESMSCTLEVDGIEKFDVRLQAVIDRQKNMFLLVPIVGSSVLVLMINGDPKNLAVVSTSEVEEVCAIIGESQFAITTEGILIAKGDENLATILTDLVAEVQKIIVVQGTSPNKVALSKISERFKQVLNGS